MQVEKTKLKHLARAMDKVRDVSPEALNALESVANEVLVELGLPQIGEEFFVRGSSGALSTVIHRVIYSEASQGPMFYIGNEMNYDYYFSLDTLTAIKGEIVDLNDPRVLLKVLRNEFSNQGFHVSRPASYSINSSVLAKIDQYINSQPEKSEV